MAKRKINGDEQVSRFLADVLATIPEDQRAVVKGALEADGAKAIVKDRVLARADYSASMDEMAAELAEGRRKIEEWTSWYGTASAEFAGAKTALDTYEQRFGKLDGSTQPPKSGLSKDEAISLLDEALTTRDAAAIDVADLLTDLKFDYREKFGERLDSKALIKFATENRLRLDIAYQQYTAPKAEELRKKDFDTAIAKAKEEGAREFASSHRLPVTPSSNEPASWERPKDLSVGKSQTERVAAAIADFGK